MTGFIIRRILWTVPVLLLATFVTFALVKAMPYEPFINNPKLAPSVKQNLEELYGLDKPYLAQYGAFLSDIVTGDFGLSTKPGAASVGDILAEKFPTTLLLGALAFVFAAVLGVGLGILAAVRAHGPVDWIITIIGTAAFALPSFLVAILWVVYTGQNFETKLYGWNTWSERIGPIVVLGLIIMPYFSRIVRASMLEALQQEYVVTAAAKGLPWRVTVLRHVLRNSLIPVVTNAGPLFGFIITGSFIIEYVMSVPGIANEYVDSLRQPLDSRMVLATTVLLASVIVFMNLIVDVVVGWLDPRISHD